MAALPFLGALFGGSASSTLSAIGTVVSGVGTIAGGVAANNAARFEAQQLEAKGKEELAASQREAEAKRREGRLVASRQQALAAASGAGAGTDAPTIVKLMTDTAGQAEYGALAETYGGFQRRAGLFDEARGRRMSGRASLLGSVIGGFGQTMSGLGSIYSKRS